MAEQLQILVLQGPNLNLLGKRETSIYGNFNNEDLMNQLSQRFPDIRFSYFQSNVEGEIIDRLHQADTEALAGVILNAGGYTHTSVAIADAIAAIQTEVVEVHISNIHKREAFRQKSLIAAYCKGSISGFGMKSYELAVFSLI